MRKVVGRIRKGILLMALLVMCMPQAAEATQQSGEVVASEIEDVTTTGLSIDMETEESTYKAGDGTIHWKPVVMDDEYNVISPAKLTLDNATITAEHGGIDIWYGTDITVEVIGTNRITCAEGLALYIEGGDEPINTTITGDGTLAMETERPYNGTYGMQLTGDLYVTGGVNVSMPETGVWAHDLIVDDSQLSCDVLAVTEILHVKSGILNATEIEAGGWGSKNAIIDEGATVNADFMELHGNLKNEGEVNAVVATDKVEGTMTVYGDVILSADGNSKGYIESDSITNLVISEGATLTVPKGDTLDLTDKELEFSGNGSLVVEGSVELPEGTTTEDIGKMNITGEGVIVVAGPANEEGTREDKVYTTDGSALNAVSGLDFTNVGTGDGQTVVTGDGYAWDATTKTLTLTDAYIDGSLNLPTESKIVISGMNIVAGNVTVVGNVSDAFTLSGEGALNVDGKKYVSHDYGEPTFTWTQTKDGYTVKAAFVCQGGEDTQMVDAKVTSEKKDATCTEDGVITYTARVTFKGKEYVETKEVAIPKVEHTWDEGVVSKDTTTTEKGEMTYTCTTCKEQKVEAIEILQVGMLIKDSKAIYIVTQAGVTGGTVEFVKPTKKSVTTLKIPPTIKASGVTYKVTSIAAKACKGYTKLKTVTIGSNVKTIGKEAFSGCKKIKTMKMGSNVTTIGDKAFYNCVKITNITIPSKVSKIGKQTFYKCKNLKNITIKTSRLTKSKVGKDAFKGIKSTVTIKVPKKKYSSYKSMLQKKGVSKKASFKKI